MLERPVVRRSFSRRRFFRGLGAASLIAQPLLRAHQANAAREPKVVIFYVGGGMHPHLWKQSLAHGADLMSATLTAGLDVFEKPEYRALKAYLSPLYGLQQQWGLLGGAQMNSHQVGDMAALIGMHNTKATGKEVSPDRLIASQFSGTAFPSIRLRSFPQIDNNHSYPSHGGSSSLSKSFTVPTDAYSQVFGWGSSSLELQGRRDVLAQSLEQCKAVVAEVETQLGAAAAQRVGNHCDSMRDMEKRLDMQISSLTAGGGSCGGPAPTIVIKPGTASDAGVNHKKAKEGLDSFTRLATNALACGRTRVVMYEWWGDNGAISVDFFYPMLGGSGGFAYIHRDVFHYTSLGEIDGFPQYKYSDKVGQDMLLSYARYLFGQFAALGKSLLDLGLLDDTIILWATGEAEGWHIYNNTTPCLYLGKGGGRFKTGKWLLPRTTTAGAGISDVYTTFLRGLGMQQDRFGDDNSTRTRYGIDGDMLVSA